MATTPYISLEPVEVGHNEARHRMSGTNVNLKDPHWEMPLIGALGCWAAAASPNAEDIYDKDTWLNPYRPRCP
jgi:hypothetical protein